MDGVKPCLSQSPPAGAGYGGQAAEFADYQKGNGLMGGWENGENCLYIARFLHKWSPTI